MTRVSGWRRWTPLLWTAYGTIYVVVFLVRGAVLAGVVATALVVVVGLGLAWELRQPRAAQPQQLGWRQDERQLLIHQRSMALVGHVAIASALVAALIAFAVDSDASTWPILAVLGLLIVYGAGTVFYQRRS